MIRAFLIFIVGLLAAVAHAGEAPRVVVIGPALADTIVALGAADTVVGRGGGTDHLPEIAGAPQIPGFRLTSAENLLSLNPTLVVLSERQSNPQVITQLQAAGVTVEVMGEGDTPSVDTPIHHMERLGALLGREEAAQAAINRYRTELEAALALVDRARTRPRGLFILSGGGRPTLVAGGDTHIALLIDLAGGENMTGGISYFKPISQEVMVAAAPEFILVNAEGLDLKEGLPVALSAPGAQLTPAAQTGNIFTLSEGMLTGLGPSTPQAIIELARKMHPDLADD